VSEPAIDVGLAYVFSLEMDSVTIASFKEVTGLSVGRQPVEYWENTADGKPIVRKSPGRQQIGDITLRRGMTSEPALWEWYQKVDEGNMTLGEGRRNGSIVLYDLTGTEAMRFNFTNGWVSKMSLSGLEAGSNQPLVEECVITHEGLAKQ
jgi:phage tail-like protein